ncbi:CDP-glycerol glycerophosphotransferase family protein [Streptomyces sp. NPDC058691]|uniref:bifunctional glycosyltransferase/CDP-glycerol:glycerophosphate glycerophosphotransferase n=1 Tax=Streptomyces sp. NPDC058691 TaxID=3346601 RepID=UPI00364ADAB0
MPRFSVIVPIHLVQAHLHECLESVLGQSFTDLELIAVDDRSPDGCGAIIDSFAARDRRVTAVHLAENVGLGRARNAGIAHATGDYLLFLDGDDALTPGALRAVADRLAGTAEPDVLVFDYARTYWDGRVARNRHAHLLSHDGPPPGPLAGRPGLLRLLPVAWNKAYRREFVQRRGLSFPPGWYEDVPWTYPALLGADTVAVLDRVCVHYRQRRRGSIRRTTSTRHFDVFEQYERLFAFLDRHPVHDPWRPALFRRMADHLLLIYNSPVRLPRSSRAAYFKRCGLALRRLRPEESGRPGRGGGSRRLLVRLGARHVFDAVRAAGALRRRLRSLAEGARRAGRAAALRAHYRLQRHRPLDPRSAVFAADRYGGYACNPAAVETAVRGLAPHLRTAWITTAEHAGTLPPGVRRLQPDSPAYWTALARATYLVNNVNFPHAYVKRPGQVNLHTHQGTPLGHMGLDVQGDPAASAGRDFARMLAHTDRWDYCLSANPHSSVVWERAYPAGYATLEYGQPRNDVLLRASADDVLRLRAALGLPEGVTALLYAPAHRDHRHGFRPAADPARLGRELGPGFVILYRAPREHPDRGCAAGLPEDLPGNVLDVSAHASVQELCLASDGLITDYASLMFDYSVLDRPVVVHAEDRPAHGIARGAYLDITAEPPGLVAGSCDELLDILLTGAWRGPLSTRLRAAFRARYCPWDDGRAAERVVRRVFLGEPGGLPPVMPPEERRPAPAPEQARAQARAQEPGGVYDQTRDPAPGG